MFSRRATVTRWFLQIAMLVLAVLFVLPLVVAVRISFRGDGWGNYLAVLEHPLVPRFFLNTAVVAVLTIGLVYVVAGCAAYALAKLRLAAREILFLALLAGLMIPPVALLVPLYFTIRGLGLFGNPLSIVLPLAALTVPLATSLMRSFLDGIPNELLEAARVDGCSSWRILWWIVRPLSRQITTVVIIYTFLVSWNEYFLPLAFMQHDADRLVTQAPQYFISQFGQDTGKVFASLILISIPVVIAYIATRKVFVEGITAGSVK